MTYDESVEAALSEGVDAEKLAVAAHEIGHMLVWRHHGFAAGPVRVKTGIFGFVADSECPAGANGSVDEHNIGGYLLGCAAGAAAQRRCARLYLRGRYGSHGSSEDRGNFRYMRRAWEQSISWPQARRKAEKLLDQYYTERLDELTVIAAKTGRAKW